MADDQNLDPFLKSLGARRLWVDHYTEHDFEMERLGWAQNAEIYAKRLETLEAAGWEPFRGPFYYARREFHGGHHPPGTEKRVPTGVAFAMFREANPGVELEPWRPHPRGWTPPTTTQGMFHCEQISVEPMKMPAGKIFTMKCEYGTPEEQREREERRERWEWRRDPSSHPPGAGRGSARRD